MKLYKSKKKIYIEDEDLNWFVLQDQEWDALINRKNLYNTVKEWLSKLHPLEKKPLFPIDAPIGSQEIWAAGVTYLKSKKARMEEAAEAGGGDFYDRVYDAERPEIFFKATAARTVGDMEKVFIRRDSTWDVPEPELTLLVSSFGTLEGYTIGNDMSSRSIEGENPLYLPQAKTYEKCASLGPCIWVRPEPISPHTHIHMVIDRVGEVMYDDRVAISQMKRSHEELISYLFRECDFPTGCFLMTGTSLVPDPPFSLEEGDKIIIKIDGIGELTNFVGRKS